MIRSTSALILRITGPVRARYTSCVCETRTSRRIFRLRTLTVEAPRRVDHRPSNRRERHDACRHVCGTLSPLTSDRQMKYAHQRMSSFLDCNHRQEEQSASSIPMPFYDWPCRIPRPSNLILVSLQTYQPPARHAHDKPCRHYAKDDANDRGGPAAARDDDE